jgi:hypothetical protein
LDTKLTLVTGFIATAIPLLLGRRLEPISGSIAVGTLTIAFLIALDGLRACLRS